MLPSAESGAWAWESYRVTFATFCWSKQIILPRKGGELGSVCNSNEQSNKVILQGGSIEGWEKLLWPILQTVYHSCQFFSYAFNGYFIIIFMSLSIIPSLSFSSYAEFGLFFKTTHLASMLCKLRTNLLWEKTWDIFIQINCIDVVASLFPVYELFILRERV